MEVVAKAVVGRIFFGVYKIQEPLQSHAPFPTRTNQVTPYTMGKSEGQRKRPQMWSGVVLGTEGGKRQPSLVGAESLGMSGDPPPA